MSENTFLNKSWTTTRLEEIASRITKGGTPTTYGYSFQTSGINFIKVENIEKGKVLLSTIKDYISIEAHIYQNKSMLEEEDILFSIAGTIGETCIVKNEYLPANTNQALAIIKGTSQVILPGLLKYHLDAFVARVKSKARGGAMNNVSLGDLKSLIISIPPLPEQHAIVPRIEQLFSELDKGIELLKTAQQQLKVYRQSVLKWAFEGKLTNENFREGVLPEGWKWMRVKEIAENIQYGFTESSAKEAVGPKFLRITDIQENKVNWREVPYCKIANKEIGKYKLKDGDVVFARTGATVGKSYLIKGEVPEAIFASYLIRLRFSKIIFDKYVWYFFQSPFYWNQIIVGQVGTGQPNVNGTKLGQLNIILCSLEEQHQIVREIESRLSECDNMETTIATSLQQAEVLRQSILKKAFEGKLLNEKELEAVRQDPTWEPAERLLERIRAEKAGLHSEQKGRKSKSGVK